MRASSWTGCPFSDSSRIIANSAIVSMPDKCALTTLSAARIIDTCIEQVIRVALRTAGLPSHILTSVTAPHIFQMRYRLQMHRIYTGRIMTQMVKFKSFWDRAYQQFVGEPMGKNIPMVAIKKPIAVMIGCLCPQPTGRSFIDLCPKPLFVCNSSHNKTLQCIQRPSVLALNLRLAPEGLEVL